MTKLEELKAAFEAATKGEWDYTIQSNGLTSVYGNCQQDSMADAELIAFDLHNTDDATFIALSHNLMPALLESVDLLRLAAATIEIEYPESDDRYEIAVRANELLEKLR